MGQADYPCDIYKEPANLTKILNKLADEQVVILADFTSTEFASAAIG